jgi:type IV pilus assembly protein PilV
VRDARPLECWCFRWRFTLVEVLVALFVVALGVAGAAAVQALAVRGAGEAALRLSDGPRLASSLAERMRANPAAMALPDAPIPISQFDAGTDGARPLPRHPCYGAAAAAGSWRTSTCSRPQPSGQPTFPEGACASAATPGTGCKWPAGLDLRAAPGAPIAIKLGWRDRQADAACPICAGRVPGARGGCAMSRACVRARPA